MLPLSYYIIDYYKPEGRRAHSTIVIANKLYSFGGYGLPQVHNSDKKRRFMSNIDVLHLDTGIWRNHSTTGDPHPGVRGYAIGTKLTFFGGYCGHGDCYHNNISELDSDTLTWNTVSDGHQRDGPMKKGYCGMIPLYSEGEHYLFIIGGRGPPPNNPQPNAEYQKLSDNNITVQTNEQHIYSISTGKL